MKLEQLFEDTLKHAVAKYLDKHHPLLSDIYEWKDFRTIKVLVPADADYLMKNSKKYLWNTSIQSMTKKLTK